MDDYGPDAIISASCSARGEENIQGALNGMSLDASELTIPTGTISLPLKRRESNQSMVISTYGDPVGKQENVLVCVRVRPPAAISLSETIHSSALDEAWIVDSDENTLKLAERSAGIGTEYRFGKHFSNKS